MIHSALALGHSLENIEEMTFPMLVGMLRASAHATGAVPVGPSVMSSKSPIPKDFFGRKSRR